jgi:hypothetical protein
MLSPEHQAYREALGRAIKTWARLNGFSIQVPHDWAKAVGSEGPWNSQWSLLTRGKLDAKPLFFVSVGRFNRAIAAKDFTAIKDRKLLDRLKAAEPFLGNDDAVWGPMEFYGAYVGELTPPDRYLSDAAEITEEQAIKVTEELREQFRRHASEGLLPPKQAFAQLAEKSGLGAARQTRLQQILSGWDSLTVEDLEEGTLIRAVDAWTDDEALQKVSTSTVTGAASQTTISGSTRGTCTAYPRLSPRTTTTAPQRPLKKRLINSTIPSRLLQASACRYRLSASALNSAHT